MKRVKSSDAGELFNEFLEEQAAKQNKCCVLALAIGNVENGHGSAEGRFITMGCPKESDLVGVLRALAEYATAQADNLEGVLR